MIICRKLDIDDSIESVKDWSNKCPPQGKKKHWVKGRSAKETAKHWIHGAPIEFMNIFHKMPINIDLLSPEFVSYFDQYQGNGRNHDLIGIDKSTSTIISIESKVDEPFGDSLGDYSLNVIKKKAKGENTNADKRLEGLKSALFNDPNSKKLDDVMYQLVSGIAGLLAEVKNQKCTRAVFVVQTFLTSEMDSKKHHKNQRDYDFFLEIISNGKYSIIHNGDLLGPIRVPGNKYIPNDVDLYFGKCDIKLK